METMSEGEWRAFVSVGTRTGKLAIARKDGRPHVTPIWFLLDGDEVVFTTYAPSLKGKVLRRDPRLAICVDDGEPPYSFVMIEAEASFVDDLDVVRAWAARIATRYMGADRAAEYGERNGVPGELLVRARITHVVARAGIAD